MTGFNILNVSDNDFRSPKRRRCAEEEGSGSSASGVSASKCSDDETEEGSVSAHCMLAIIE